MKHPILHFLLILAALSLLANFSHAQTGTPTPTASPGTGDAAPRVSLHYPVTASNSSNNTVVFSCNATDDQKLDNVTLYFNYTAWHANSTNSTPANNTFHNYTLTLPDGNYAWNCRAVDNGTNASFASSNFTFMLDSGVPTFSNNQTNSTVNGSAVLFSLYWADGLSGLSRYIFSFDNGSATYTNDSAVAFSGGSNTSNVTKYVNQTNGTTIHWRVYAWDTAGNSNASQTYSFTTNYTSSTDAQAPQYSGNQTNSTLNGSAILFSLYWTDNTALSNYTFSFDNGTGTFTNDSSVPFSGTTNTSNATKYANQSNGTTIRWIVYAWDSTGNMNVSQTYSFTTNSNSSDVQAPQYSSNQTNSTIAGQAVLFSLYWTDNIALSSYVFSFDNGTGTFTNDSLATFSGTTNASNVTKVVNSTTGSAIRWMVWANDSSGNANSSPIYSFTSTTASATNTAPYLVSGPTISPDPADNSTALSCAAKFADTTNSSLTYVFTWYKSNAQNTTLDSNKTSVSNNTESTASGAVPIALLAVGSTWICGVRGFDGSLYSSWSNSTPVEILSTTAGLVNRVTASCPSTLTNQAGTVIVSYYKLSKLTCTGITVTAKNSAGTDVTSASIGAQNCLSNGKATYSANFSTTGTYTITASAGSSASTCTIEFKSLSLLPTHVPDFPPLLAPVIAVLALLVARASKKNQPA